MNLRLLPLTLVISAAFAGSVQAQNLMSLFETARGYDATYKAAQYQYTANLSKGEQAKAVLLPTVGLSANLNKTEVDLVAASQTVNSQSRAATLSASQPLYRPANTATYQQGMRQLELASIQLKAAEQDLMVRLSQAYFDVLTAQDNVELFQNKKALIKQQLQAAQSKFEVGSATIVDANDAQARFDHAGEHGFDRIVLTASGGPFRDMPAAAFAAVTPEQACAHPNWVMGRKISVDSATMMNKGLELIEARWMFNMPEEKIDVVIHPQAIIHGTVHFTDGSVIAQMSEPDMAIPISYCLHWPERGACVSKPLSLSQCATLDFIAVDDKRFPAIQLVREALREGPATTIALNAANECAVAAFLARRIRFTDIVPLVANISASFAKDTIGSMEDVLAIDRIARERTEASLSGGAKRYA